MQGGYGQADGGWLWFDASYNGDKDGYQTNANDEYQWTLSPVPAAGTYPTAFRASLNGGPWLDCLTDGPSSSIDLQRTGTLTAQ